MENNTKNLFIIKKNKRKTKEKSINTNTKKLENTIITFHNSYIIENIINININKSNLNNYQLNLSKIDKQDNNEEFDDNFKENNNNCSNECNCNHITRNIYSLGNDIKVKRNNKMIFMNQSLIKQKPKKKEIKEGKNKRSSIYRGVSKNGNKWQAIVSSKISKGYIGIYPTEELAARVYDICSIKNKGLKAQTNFVYTIHQIGKIIEANIDVNSDKIDKIILDLIQ